MIIRKFPRDLITINKVLTEKQYKYYCREIDRIKKLVRLRKKGNQYVLVQDRNSRKLNLFSTKVRDYEANKSSQTTNERKI